MQIAYAFASPLPQDKVPNNFGQKAIVVDCTGVVVDKKDEWLATAASIGSHLIRLAIAQQIIDFEDLEELVPGERFKLADLLRRRAERQQPGKSYTPDPQLISNMCAPQPSPISVFLHEPLPQRTWSPLTCNMRARRYVFCRWYGLTPLRYCPLAPWAISAHIARFGAAANMKITARDLRTAMAFGRIKHAQVHKGGHEDRLAVSLAGGWSANANTYKNDYLHPAFFNALFSHLVRL